MTKCFYCGKKKKPVHHLFWLTEGPVSPDLGWIVNIQGLFMPGCRSNTIADSKNLTTVFYILVIGFMCCLVTWMWYKKHKKYWGNIFRCRILRPCCSQVHSIHTFSNLSELKAKAKRERKDQYSLFLLFIPFESCGAPCLLCLVLQELCSSLFLFEHV